MEGGGLMADNNTSQTKENEPELTLEQAKEQLVEIGKKRGVLAYEEIADRLSSLCNRARSNG